MNRVASWSGARWATGCGWQLLTTTATSQRVMDALAQPALRPMALDVRLLRRVKPSMEDVFVHLVDEQRRAQ